MSDFGRAKISGLALDAAYVEVGEGLYRASPLTIGPWNPEHQHAGPPSALICRAIERAAAPDGRMHLGRLTVNLLRPAPVGDCRVEISADYIGRNAGHFSGLLTADGKDIARFTALMQREEALAVPDGTLGHTPRPARRSRSTSARSSKFLSVTDNSATPAWSRTASRRENSSPAPAPPGFE